MAGVREDRPSAPEEVAGLTLLVPNEKSIRPARFSVYSAPARML